MWREFLSCYVTQFATVEFVPRELGWWGIRIPNSLLANQRWSFGGSHFRAPVQSSLTSLPERFLGAPREKLFRTSSRQPLLNPVKSELPVIWHRDCHGHHSGPPADSPGSILSSTSLLLKQ
jgi:hypothetical protein